MCKEHLAHSRNSINACPFHVVEQLYENPDRPGRQTSGQTGVWIQPGEQWARCQEAQQRNSGLTLAQEEIRHTSHLAQVESASGAGENDCREEQVYVALLLTKHLCRTLSHLTPMTTWKQSHILNFRNRKAQA